MKKQPSQQKRKKCEQKGKQKEKFGGTLFHLLYKYGEHGSGCEFKTPYYIRQAYNRRNTRFINIISFALSSSRMCIYIYIFSPIKVLEKQEIICKQYSHVYHVTNVFVFESSYMKLYYFRTTS